METEKLYYRDPFLREFPATVLRCAPSGETWKVVLDQTAFYPEGGGQPADRGTLSLGGGTVRVLDVHEKDGEVLHTCDGPLAEGSIVQGRIDWARRFDHMQQHSGEHILSGILCRDYHGSNVGFHMGAETVTIDYDVDLTWEQILEAERLANEAVWADREVEISYPGPAELSALDYRSKKELTGAVRIVTFPGADCCACCGTHVLRAGQAGPIKVLSCQKFREGVRLELVCGGRALRYLSAVYNQDHAISQRLSVKPLETAAAVERLEAELAVVKARQAELEDALFACIAREHASAGDALVFQPSLRPDGVRKLADDVARACGGLAAVFSGEGTDYRYALVRHDGADISSLVKAMNGALRGRGGGRGGFAQGSVRALEAEIRAFWDSRDKEA